MRTTIIKEDEEFRLTLSKKECLAPKGVFHIEMFQEQLDNGSVSSSSIYDFFLTSEELKTLSENLVK
jgi:hypothetical protein